jgi:hypothetical protein
MPPDSSDHGIVVETLFPFPWGLQSTQCILLIYRFVTCINFTAYDSGRLAKAILVFLFRNHRSLTGLLRYVPAVILVADILL